MPSNSDWPFGSDDVGLVRPGEGDAALIRRSVERVYAFAAANRDAVPAGVAFAIGVCCGAALRAAEASATDPIGCDRSSGDPIVTPTTTRRPRS